MSGGRVENGHERAKRDEAEAGRSTWWRVRIVNREPKTGERAICTEYREPKNREAKSEQEEQRRGSLDKQAKGHGSSPNQCDEVHAARCADQGAQDKDEEADVADLRDIEDEDEGKGA